MKNHKLSILKFSPSLLILSLVFLFNPNYNIIDPLPDFVAYFALASLIGRKGDFIPYLSEAKKMLKRLGLLGLLKIPAVFVMYANVTSGRDIIPLFTLVFSTLEIILLIGAVDNLFLGLYYVGERSSADRIIAPFKLLGHSFKAEAVMKMSYVFLITKSAFAFLPEMCLLTVESPKTALKLRAMYLPSLLISLITVALLGVIWLVLCLKYLKCVKDGCNADTLGELIEKEDMEVLIRKTKLKSTANTLTLLGFSTLFLFDLRFAETGEVNILPHFLFGLILLGISLKLFDGKIHKIAVSVSSVLYSLSSILFGIFNIRFLDNFSYKELSDSFANPEAIEAYKTVEILAALEALFFFLTVVSVALGFISFIIKNTALSPSDPSYSKQDKQRHVYLSVKSGIAFLIMLAVGLLKCLNVYFKAEVILIFGRTDLIFSGKAPWLGTVIFITVILLTLFFHATVEDVKEDVKLKYKD